MTVLNLRLPEKYSKGATGGATWLTEVNVTEGGVEKRNIAWENLRGRWNIGHLVKTPAQLGELRNVFNVAQGMAYWFLFKDWLDFEANGHALPTGHLPVIGEGDASATQFQLAKSYPWVIEGTAQAGGASTITLAASQADWPTHATDDTYNGLYIRITGGTGSGQVAKISDYVGSTKVATVAPAWSTQPDSTSTYAIEVYRTQRIVNRPVPGTVTAYVNGVADGSATVDVTTGVVTLSSAAASGAIVTADFEFDCVVRFDSDLMQARYDTVNTRSWPSIVLVERKPVETL